MARLSFTTVVLAGALFTAAGCGRDVTVERGLTGVELTVRYDAALALNQLEFTVTHVDGSPLLAPRRRPDSPARLQGEASTIIILLAEPLAGQQVSIRVDGYSDGELVASGSAGVLLTARVLIEVDLVLGDPWWCGDGTITLPEECDDGNNDDDDGCDANCDVETGHTCSKTDDDDGSPSTCRPDCAADVCGDGCCSGLESPVGCIEDCGRCTDSCAGGTCQQSCPGPTCAVACREGCGCAIDCPDVNKCTTSCPTGASCIVDCTGVGLCAPTCTGAEARCEIDCSGAGNCAKARCEAGASCLIVCGGAESCAFDACEGVESSCPGDILVCNRPCPP